jgi:predicted PurR-regulated permease PerM
MLGFDRNAARYTWTIVLVLAAIAVLYLIRKTLFIFAVALLFAYLLTPLVNFLDKVLPMRSRAPALALAYVIVLSLVVLLLIEVGSRVVEQANALAQRIPELVSKMSEPSGLPLPRPVVSVKQTILNEITEQIKEHGNEILGAASKAGLRVLSAAGNLILVVVIPILSFFFLKDGRSIRRQLIESVDEGPRRDLLRGILLDLHVLLAQYMRALFVLAAATFAFYGAFFLLMDVPYSMLLASIAFVLEFIPMIGPLVAAGIILLVTGFSGSSILAMLIFLIAYRLFQDYVMQPYLLGTGIEIHPALVIFGVFAGGEIAGIPGSFLSIPILALLRIIYRRILKAQSKDEPVPVI